MKSLKLQDAASILSISIGSIIDILSENFEDNEIHSMSVPDLVYQVNSCADFENDYWPDLFHEVYIDDRNY